jgi:two-component sensor histidine kinase
MAASQAPRLGGVRANDGADGGNAEIEASRARIVAAADQARRRLERDLHDGAQQQLVLATLTLKQAQVQARGTPAERPVSDALAQLERALTELRELARGIHPAVLSEHGLAAALESLVARSPIPVELRAPRERLAPTAEAAIYFTVAEALTNIAKHAQASLARVDVDVEDGTLIAQVVDDGVGGADATAGSGLLGLADRLDTLGGTLTVESPAGGGTVVLARVPLRPPDALATLTPDQPAISCLCTAALLAPELAQQAQQRGAQRLHLVCARQLRPALFDARGRRVRDRRDRAAAFGQEDQPRAAVARVRAALDVARALELVDRLRHRLLAHARQLGESRHGDAFRRHEREHVRRPGTYVIEACTA